MTPEPFVLRLSKHASERVIHHAPPRGEKRLSLLVFLAALALYVATLAPGLLWGGGDFARFQTWAYLGHFEGKVDIFAHPLWVYLAHPFTWLPIRDPAWRANFAAAVFAALALVFCFRSARLLSSSLPAALLATGALAVSQTFWTYAVMPKVYSLNALLLAACIYLVLRWRASGRDAWLALFAFLYGLSLLNHLVMAPAAAGFAAFIAMTLRVRRRNSARSALLAVLCFAAGLVPYVRLMRQTATTGATGHTVITYIAGLAYAAGHPVGLLKACGWGIGLGLYQFPLTTAVAVVGFLELWRRDAAAAALLALIVLGTVAFLIGALHPEAGTYVWFLHYYLQAYVAVALAMAPGFEVVWIRWCTGRRLRQAAVVTATLVAPIIVYAAAPAIARHVVRNVPDFRPLPGRDNFTYVLSPWKQNEVGARAYGEAMLQALPEGSVLFADYGPWAVLRYLQVVEHARPDIEVVHLETEPTQVPLMLTYSGKPNLFLADTYRYYDLDGIRQHFDLVPAGPIYRLVPKAAAGSN
jgi:Protein O-mannosyl-transferase TMEM260-like